MELKTAKQFVDEHSEFGGKVQTRDDLVKMMKQYAEQEVKKHLERASNEAMTWYSMSFGIYGIDKKSITGIKI